MLLLVCTKAEEVVVPETTALVKVWADVVVVTPKVEEPDMAIAPALELPSEIVPVEVPVLILVAKLEEALILVVAPVIVKPSCPVKSPAEVTAPEPDVEIFPEVVIASPVVTGERVVPDLDQYP